MGTFTLSQFLNKLRQKQPTIKVDGAEHLLVSPNDHFLTPVTPWLQQTPQKPRRDTVAEKLLEAAPEVSKFNFYMFKDDTNTLHLPSSP